MKFLLPLSFVLVVFTSTGQYTKGTKFIAGNFSIDRENSESEFPSYDLTSKEFSLFTSLAFGTALNEEFFFISGLFFSNLSLRRESIFPMADGTFNVIESKSNSENYGLSSSIEHFKRLNDKLYFVSRISGSVRFGKSDFSDHNRMSEWKTFSYSIFVQPRLQYLINDKWAISSSIGSVFFSHQRRKEESTSEKNKLNQFGSDFGLNSFEISIRFYLNNTSE